MKKNLFTATLLVVAFGLSGCVALTSSDKAAIDAALGNANEWNTRASSTTQPSAADWSEYQTYAKTNADNWQHLDNIAHQVTTQPAGGK